MPTTSRQEVASTETLFPRVVAPEEEGVEWIPGWLKLGLVWEGPRGVRSATEPPEAGLMATALTNLRQQSSSDRFYSSKSLPGLRMYLGGDGHAAARALLLKELLQPWPVGGVLAMMPSADQLLVMPMDTLSAVSQMPFLAHSGRTAWSVAHQPVSDQLFWFDGEGWAHVPVEAREDSMEVNPPPEFLLALRRLAALSLYTVLPEG